MSDFNTILTVKGTMEEYLAIMRVLHSFADERIEQYHEYRNCWYLDGEVGDINEASVKKYLKKKVLNISFGGPYGHINGPVRDEVDLFERIADAAPNCWFEGSIAGWDVGAEQRIDAKLENAHLYLHYKFKEFGGNEWDDEEPDGEWDDEYEEFEENEEEKWDTVYDPVTHEYQRVAYDDEADRVTVMITLTDLHGKQYRLVLPSEDIWNPTNLHCFPRDFLEADTADKLIALLLHAVDGDGWQERKKDILSWKTEIPEKGFSMLELTKIHDHEESLFFDWLRSPAVGNLKKPAKSIINSSEENKGKSLEEFEKTLITYQPWFPDCEWTGWPEFCICRVVGELDPSKKNAQFRPLEKDPEQKLVTVLDWHCVASDLEEFAKFLCSKNEPREFAVETVKVDFKTNTTEQTAVYMPGGSAPEVQ